MCHHVIPRKLNNNWPDMGTRCGKKSELTAEIYKFGVVDGGGRGEVKVNARWVLLLAGSLSDDDGWHSNFYIERRRSST